VRAALTITISLALAAPAQADDLRLEKVGRFHEPVYVAGSERTLAVVERYGLVRLVPSGRVLVDLRRRVLVEDPRETVDQRGLLSMAFAPDYRRSRRFYVMYVNRRGRLRVDMVRRRHVRRILDLGEVASQHHGGQLQFGPDGLLYVSTGMGDDPSVSQDPSHPGGKILRLDPRRPRPDVYALGLRNPWRFSFHRGRLLIGDVGESAVEEVNVAGAPGMNFGWPAYEGDERRPEFTPPALAHRHPRWCAITGGYVRRGRYLYGDLCSGRIWSARIVGDRFGRPRRTRLRVPYLVSFGRDGRGRVYAVSFFGAVYRIAQSRSR
jgi:glucose/arabinose dehydrogenase